MYTNRGDTLSQVVAALLAMSTASCVIAHGDHADPGPNPLYHSESHFYVPKGLLSLHVETQDQISKWQQAVELCTPVQPTKPLESSCIATLSEYFMDAPVWDYGSLYYVEFSSFGRADPFPINPRPVLLPYGPADYGHHEVPRWQDIFDGQIESRKDTFFQVAADPKCQANVHGGIQEDMGDHCYAREMYKYATYLDACTTAMRRLKVLNRVTGRAEYKGLSTYEMTLQVVEEKIEDFVQQDMIKQRLEKGYLHASWVAHQCAPHGLALLPLTEEQNRNPGGGFAEVVEIGSDRATRWAVGHSQTVALKISSRSGDEWAVRSYPMTPLDEPEFLYDVYEKYPILYHRHLGSTTFAGYLSRVEQRRHQAQAYLLLKQTFGSRVAQLSYDAADLKQEIDFIQKGGELTLFLPDKESPRETGSESNQEPTEVKVNGKATE